MNVLITGASGGIGAAIARRFSTDARKLALIYNQGHERMHEISHFCSINGAEVISYSVNLAKRDELSKMLTSLQNDGFSPDIIINNAAIAHYGLLTDMTEAEWDDLFAVNLHSIFQILKTLVPQMVSRKYGRIINLSSVWGETGASCEAAYAASKGALNSLTKSLAKEWAPSGITVNAVSPGFVDTQMNQQLNADERKLLIAEIPAGRAANVEEIAELVYFLAQPSAGYINGQIIGMNGAWHT